MERNILTDPDLSAKLEQIYQFMQHRLERFDDLGTLTIGVKERVLIFEFVSPTRYGRMAMGLSPGAKGFHDFEGRLSVLFSHEEFDWVRGLFGVPPMKGHLPPDAELN
jgi:hypothetical protein